MLHSCARCGEVIKEGERVEVLVEATYHVLKSQVAFALDKTSLEADTSTLRHVSCTYSEGN